MRTESRGGGVGRLIVSCLGVRKEYGLLDPLERSGFVSHDTHSSSTDRNISAYSLRFIYLLLYQNFEF